MVPDGRSSPGQESLRHNERLAAAVEMATDAIIVIDDGGRIRLFNAAAERLFGCSKRDAIDTHLERFIPARLHSRYRAGMNHWRQANPQARDVRGRSIWQGLRVTGEQVPCEVSIAPCQVVGTRELMLSVRDITRRRQSAKANRRRVEFEKFLFDLSSTFLAMPEESIDAHMSQGLARVGAFLEMDRVTLLELSQGQGIGFDPAKLVDEAKDGHVGWGLFSIRERLMLLGGRFDIESAPGRGTTFRLIAPREIVQRHLDAEAVIQAPSALPNHQARGGAPYALKIVIADDQPALRKTFRELLQARPEFQVVGEAANGLEAVAQARTLRPDVLMDISMPEMDGVEATRHIRVELPFIHILGFSIYPRTQGSSLNWPGPRASSVKASTRRA